MPIKWVHAVAAITFIAIGIATLIWAWFSRHTRLSS
jgi:hypothetical protein